MVVIKGLKMHGTRPKMTKINGPDKMLDLFERSLSF